MSLAPKYKQLLASKTGNYKLTTAATLENFKCIFSICVFQVTGSHDRSLRLWEKTDEPLFVEEEREQV